MEKVTRINDFLLHWNMIIYSRFMTIFVAFERDPGCLHTDFLQKGQIFLTDQTRSDSFIGPMRHNPSDSSCRLSSQFAWHTSKTTPLIFHGITMAIYPTYLYYYVLAHKHEY